MTNLINYQMSFKLVIKFPLFLWYIVKLNFSLYCCYWE
jgi:hypothetical protein